MGWATTMPAWTCLTAGPLRPCSPRETSQSCVSHPPLPSLLLPTPQQLQCNILLLFTVSTSTLAMGVRTQTLCVHVLCTHMHTCTCMYMYVTTCLHTCSSHCGSDFGSDCSCVSRSTSQPTWWSSSPPCTMSVACSRSTPSLRYCR